MKHILLSNNDYATVDDVDYKTLMAVGKWHSSRGGYAVNYSKDQHGKRKTRYMHRLVMDRILGYPVGELEVDHVSSIAMGRDARRDNRRENLRLATHSQNQAHKRRGVNNTSSYKGVSLNGNKWEARIRYEGKRINLGRYTDALSAAQIYDAASRYLYKEFAGCNFPNTPTPLHLVKRLKAILTRYGF